MIRDHPGAPGALEDAIRDAARALGLVRLGFTSTAPFAEAEEAWRAWLAEGFHAGMRYLTTPRAAPRDLLPAARTLIVVALPCEAPPAGEPPSPSGVGRVARYARGADYHRVLHEKLAALARACADLAGGRVAARACVDTSPLFERAAAARAGVAFVGKSCMAIVPGLGSYVLLGELLVDLALQPDAPAAPRCGACTACLDACPTGALVAPYRLDARRCLSYLSIEERGALPLDLRSRMGTTLFGCDRCQQACPYNAAIVRPAAPELAPRAALAAPELAAWAAMTSSGYRRLVAGTALARASRPQLVRNAVVALGNSGAAEAVAPLVGAVQPQQSPLVRAHAAWALGRLGGAAARAPLARLAREDPDATVRAEAAAALAHLP